MLSDGLPAVLARFPDEMATLPPADLREHQLASFRNVFGVDAKIDAEGNPIEQGIGVPGHETEQHLVALKLENQRKALVDAALRGDIAIADAPATGSRG
jgi:hypothetical protein